MMKDFSILGSILTPQEKHVVLVLDAMCIKPKFEFKPNEDFIIGREDFGEFGRNNVGATHALVLMLRGLSSKWKQVIAYFFFRNTVKSEMLANIIRKASAEISRAGFSLRDITFDQEINQMVFIKEQCITEANTCLHLNPDRCVYRF